MPFVAVIIIILVVLYIMLFNKLRRLAVKVEEGAAGIDVALEKRYDLLTEEIEAVKKYLQHEKDVYTEVTAIRKGKELEEAAFQEKRELSREAAAAISEAVQKQQEQMQEIKRKMDRQQMSLDRKLGLFASAWQGLNGVSSTIDALSEQYPVLYSSISMEHFQRSIFDTEEHLQAARRLYNANVSLYNQAISAFPYLLVAKLHRMKKAQFYETEEKKRTVEVKF